MRRMLLSALVFLGVSAASLVPGRARGTDTLFEEVRSGNRATLEAIRTLSCRVTTATPLTPWGQPIAPATADFLWSNGSSRVQKNWHGFSETSVLHEGTWRSLANGRNPDGRESTLFAIKRGKPDQAHRPFDARDLGMLTLCGAEGCPRTLEQLLAGSYRLDKVARESTDGRELIVVSMGVELRPGEFSNFEFSFDPQVNYLVRKRVLGFGDDGRRETEVHRFREVAPATFFPESVETRWFEKGQLTSHQTAEFANVRINDPLPADAFDLPIPPGAQVRDEILDKEYKVDSLARQSGPAATLAKGTPLPLATAELKASSEERKPLTRWIIPVSLLLLGIGGALWFYRNWNHAR